jgi:signal transduction histidine kinase/CheY-like chemotaxis protein
MQALCGVERGLDLREYAERLVHPDDRQLVTESGRRTMETGRFIAHPHRIVRPDGEVRWMLTSGKVLRDAEGRPAKLVGGQIDVTDQRRLEDRLLQTQKIEAVESLATGIAHNFNNLLMVVGPSLELLHDVVPASHRQLLSDAREAAERAADLVRQLMTFTGQRRTGLRSAQDAGAIVERVIRMCGRTFDRHIAIRASIPSGLPLITCDPAAIEQVVLNVMLNARDAVLASGAVSPTITVEVTTVAHVPPTLERAAGRYLRIAVSDDGVGMSPDVRSRIFEPFFTTKSVAEGTGLGLATSYAFVREHGGFIECESTPGEGTTLGVHLPVADEVEAAVEPARAPPEAPKASILIVDDEDAIRRVVGRMLGVVGYRVATAASGAEALALMTRDPDIDLILLDRSMPSAPSPDFLGHTLVEALRKAAPRARVAYFTGQEVTKEEAGVRRRRDHQARHHRAAHRLDHRDPPGLSYTSLDGEPSPNPRHSARGAIGGRVVCRSLRFAARRGARWQVAARRAARRGGHGRRLRCQSLRGEEPRGGEDPPPRGRANRRGARALRAGSACGGAAPPSRRGRDLRHRRE